MDVIFNHSYILKHDEKRTYIIASSDASEGSVIKGWISRVHPVYAMIFSLLSLPCHMEDAIKKIAQFLETSEFDARTILELFLNSKESFVTDYHGVSNPFPPSLLIPVEKEVSPRRLYNPRQFVYPTVDVLTERSLTSPLGLVYMVNNICATNCLYCYADKRADKSVLNLNEIEKLCSNAKELGIHDFALTGGEVFMYKEWHSLLLLLHRYGYKPDLISTKKPLCELDIRKLKDLGIKIQVSLDSCNPMTLERLLGAGGGYLEKMLETIRLLEKYELNYQISTVLTSLNCEIANLEKLHTLLSKLKYLDRWEVRVAFRSLYTSNDFDNFKVSKLQIQKISEWIQLKTKDSLLNILWSPNNGKIYMAAKDGSRSFPGNRCSANYSHMVVLPDGKVTICEQLYWNPRFIIGDVKQQRIEEIWNSQRALELAALNQSEIQASSPCSSCKLYEKCTEYPNKCYADVLKAYGDENWDYPDPRCFYSPAFKHNME